MVFTPIRADAALDCAESQESAAVSSQPEEEPESSRQLAQEETSSLRQSQAPATSSQPEVQQAQSYQFPWGVLAALGAVVLVGFALWLRRRVVWRRRLARWTGPDANAAVLDIYRYLLRLLELQGRLPQEEQTPQELARLVEGQGGKSCLFGDPGLFTQLTELAQQARFGRTPVPRRQAEEMAAFAQRARLVTERKLTAGKTPVGPLWQGVAVAFIICPGRLALYGFYTAKIFTF